MIEINIHSVLFQNFSSLQFIAFIASSVKLSLPISKLFKFTVHLEVISEKTRSLPNFKTFQVYSS